MPTTIRLADQVKRELDRLQGAILSERGERLSHSELLARLLRFARLHEDEILEDAEPPRPTRAQLDALLARLPAAAVDTRARDYKDALYEERP